MKITPRSQDMQSQVAAEFDLRARFSDPFQLFLLCLLSDILVLPQNLLKLSTFFSTLVKV